MAEIFNILTKHNYWYGKSIPTGFIRSRYLKKIHPYLNNQLIKVLIGQRRTGKSYILRQIIASLIQNGVHPHHIFYLNKENLGFENIKHATDLLALIQQYENHFSLTGKKYIFLDEIQIIHEWEKCVTSLSQQPNNGYEVFITGSNSELLSSELASRLSGRYLEFPIFSYSFEEACAYDKKPKTKSTYLQYLQSGGLPELYHLSDPEVKKNYVAALRDSIILNDIVERYTIKQPHLLEELFTFMIFNAGALFSTHKIVNYLISRGIKTNFETVSHYVSYLQQALLVHSTPRFDITGKKIIDSPKKYYLNDLAFKNYLASRFDPGLGKSLENAIFLEAKRAGYTIYTGKYHDYEVDFILEKQNKRMYLQTAYSIADEHTAKRELSVLEKIPDNYEKAVITLDDVSFGNYHGINHIPAWELQL